MKKAFIIISITLIVTNIQAQETKTLLGTDRPSVTSISGYGGPLIFATQMNDELELSIGGKGGAVFNRKFALGGIGFWKINTPGVSGNNLSDNVNAPLQMSYGAGGVFLEYILNSGGLIGFSIPLNLMAGAINIYNYNTEAEIESSSFFIIEPGISIDLHVSNSYTQSLCISYRQAIGSSLINLEDEDISGLNVGLVFNFGK